MKSRVAKYNYGVRVKVPYDASDSEHLDRSHKTSVDNRGIVCVHDAYSTILKKATEVKETREFKHRYSRDYRSPESVPSVITEEILCYRGTATDPRWMDVDKENFTVLCTIKTDSAKLIENCLTHHQIANTTRTYYLLKFEILLSFGLTELTAQVRFFTEGGEAKHFPAEIKYSDKSSRLV